MERRASSQTFRRRWALSMGTTAGLVALLFTLLLVWGTGSNDSTAFAARATQDRILVDSVIVGATVPLSPPGTVQAGEAMKVALEIAADEINAAGGVLGQPVQLIISDTAGLPDLGEDVMDYFAQIGVAGVVGEYHSAVGLSMAEKADEHHIPVIFAETWSDRITAAGYDEVFRIAPASSMFSELKPNYLAEIGLDNVALVADDSEYGSSQAANLEAQLSERGIASHIFIAPVGTVDFSSVLADIQALSPPAQAVVDILLGYDAFRFEQQSAQAGLAPSADNLCIASSSAAISDSFWQNVPDGNYSIFAYVGIVPANYNDRTLAFATEYMSRTGKSSVEYYAMEAYDSLIIMADAINRAGSTDADAVISAIESTDLVGAQGRYYFPYGLVNPLPDGVPDYMWHQWPDPHALMIQYFKVNQMLEEAAVVYPAIYRTHGVNLIPWYPPPISTTIPAGGGDLTSPEDSTLYIFPPGTFTDTVVVTHTARFPGVSPSFGDLVDINHVFEITAVYSSTRRPAQPAPGQAYTVTVQYAGSEIGLAIENTLALHYWDGDQWMQESSSVLDAVNHTVTAMPRHFSTWAVLGETNRIYLPLVVRGR